MSESDEGFRVAVTRQKAGRFLDVSGLPLVPLGGVKSPADRLCALSIVASAKDTFVSASQGVPGAMPVAGTKTRANRTTSAQPAIRTFRFDATVRMPLAPPRVTQRYH